MGGESSKIEFKDVGVEFSGGPVGLRNISLTVAKGEFVFFVGRTGAGKSTLLKLLTREVSETQGEISLFGKDLTRVQGREIPGLRREMGIVPQDYALLPKKTVWENVAYAMRAAGHSRREVRRRVPDILDQVSIGHRADAFPNQLSGGEQQRVAIAKRYINNPPLLIADEPTGNLDPEHSLEIMETLQRLNRQGTTVLVASHDMMVIHRMGKRVVTLELGRIVSDEPGGGDVDRVMFIVGEAFVALRRNIAMAFAGITTGAIALFLLGLLAFAFQAANDYAKSVPNMFDMRVFINDGTSKDQVRKTVQQVRLMPGVAQVILIPRQRAWEKIQADHPDLTKGLENPLPDQLRVVVSDLPHGDLVAQQIQTLPTVVPEDGVHYLRREQRMAIAAIDAFKVLGLALFVLLLVSTGVLIYNTIRLTVLSRRLEIRIMRLVGASPAVIRVPFLIEGTVQGVVAGISAGLLLLLSARLLEEQLKFSVQLGSMPVGIAMAIMILTGGGYGFLCSTLAVRVPLEYR